MVSSSTNDPSWVRVTATWTWGPHRHLPSAWPRPAAQDPLPHRGPGGGGQKGCCSQWCHPLALSWPPTMAARPLAHTQFAAEAALVPLGGWPEMDGGIPH